MLKLLETFPLPSIVIDNNLDIVHINSIGLQLFDCKFSDLYSVNISSLFPDLDFNVDIDTQVHCLFNNSIQSPKLHLQFKKMNEPECYGILYLTKIPFVEATNSTYILNNSIRLLESFANKCENGVLIFNENGVLHYANKIATTQFNIETFKFNNSFLWDFFDLFTSKQDWEDNKNNFEYGIQHYILHQSSALSGSVKTYSVSLDSIQLDDTTSNYSITFVDVTDSTNDKNALDEKNSQIKMFHKNIPAVIFQFVLEKMEANYFSYVSESFEELFGFSLSINDSNWYQTIEAKPKDLYSFLHAVNDSISTLSELQYVDEVILPSGKSAWFEINAIPTKKNNTIIFNGIILDITQRKELENAHFKTNEFNNSVLFNIPADIAVFDSNHKYLFINGNAIANEELRNWMIGKTDFDYCELKGVSTALAEGRRINFERARDTHQQVDWIDEINKNGEKVFVLRRFFPFYIGKEFVYMIGYGVDITELRRTQNMLSETERQNELILKAAPDGVVMMDDHWNITFWNPKAEQIFGWNSDEVLGNNLSEVLFRNKAKKIIKESLFLDDEIYDRSDKSKILELKAYTKDGNKFPIELTIVPIDEKDNEFNYCIFIRDITERKEKELEIEKQNKLLINKNRELEQFTYITSHDLQEPLIALVTYTKLLEQEYGKVLSGEGEIFINFITKSANRMRLLILCLMQYARINKLDETSEVAFDAIVGEVLEELKPMIEESKAIVEVVNSVNFDCYPVHIKSLMHNLISNAIKFSQKKGVPHIVITSEERTKDWLFCVSDNGIGIEAKNIDQIFLIFKRLHNEKDYLGQGIGLAHCKKIIEIHQGEIWVDSQLNIGSSFYFTISKKLK